SVQTVAGQNVNLMFVPMQQAASGALPVTGGTMVGSLFLAHDPAQATEAATRQYVDARASTIFNIRGGWNASTNIPALSNGGGGGARGDVFTVTTAGSTTIDGVSTWAVGDQLQNNGTAWIKVAYSSAFGNLAFKNNNAIGPFGVDANDMFSVPLDPDLWWSIRDGSGNIAMVLDGTGTFSFGAAAVTAFAATTSTIATETVTALTA